MTIDWDDFHQYLSTVRNLGRASDITGFAKLALKEGYQTAGDVPPGTPGIHDRRNGLNWLQTYQHWRKENPSAPHPTTPPKVRHLDWADYSKFLQSRNLASHRRIHHRTRIAVRKGLLTPESVYAYEGEMQHSYRKNIANALKWLEEYCVDRGFKAIQIEHIPEIGGVYTTVLRARETEA